MSSRYEEYSQQAHNLDLKLNITVVDVYVKA